MIKACGPRVVIKVDEIPDEEITEGGIVIVDTKKQVRRAAVETGTVVSVGDACWRQFYWSDEDFTPWCKVGDRITFIRYAGRRVEDPVSGEDYAVINDEDVISVVQTKEEREALDVGK